MMNKWVKKGDHGYMNKRQSIGDDLFGDFVFEQTTIRVSL